MIDSMFQLDWYFLVTFFLSSVTVKQSNLSILHRFVLELSFSKSDVVHDKLHIPLRTGGMFYFPWHRHQIEGTDGV